MNNMQKVLSGLYTALAVLLLCNWGSMTGVADEFFEKNIRPIFVEHCYECHSGNAKKLKGNLLLDSREGFLKGGESGHAIIPGQIDRSLLLKAVNYQDGLEMPPDYKLDEDTILNIRKWIQDGAKGGDPQKNEVKNPVPSEHQKELWALSPVSKVNPPKLSQKVSNSAAPLNPIDAFINDKLQKRNLAYNKQAEPLILLRRLHFDLIGLPPSPLEIKEFISSWQEDKNEAIQSLISKLLGSNDFGERWGRHWLDVSRYADSNGKSRDVLFPHAWRYRNWVIDAMNKDLPFNEFIVHQIAGDLIHLENQQESEDALVATGFLAIGSKPLVGGNLQLDLIDDQIDVVTRGFLGLTVSCARCHDHKFDPISIEDYYAIAGIFGSTKTFYGGGPNRPKTLSQKARQWLPLESNRNEIIKRITKLEKDIASAKKKNKKKQPEESQKTLKLLEAELDAIDLQLAMAVQDNPKPSNMNVRIRGEKNKKGPIVKRGFLSSVKFDHNLKIQNDVSGRMELAQWIAHPQNPLTFRVQVNRIWMHLMGRGLVDTVDNFGANGSQPSHPELLDWLTHFFIENDFSRKRLINLIVSSEAYQRSSSNSSTSTEIDPENEFYWRANMKQMELEPMRDSILMTTGLLDKSRPKTSQVALIGEGEIGRGINTRPLRERFYHRAVYLPVIRTSLLNIHKTFDLPDPSNLQSVRNKSNVPSQALFFMNDPLVLEVSSSLQKILETEYSTIEEMIDAAFWRILNRPPTSSEIHKSMSFITGFTNSSSKPKAISLFCQSLLASAEFRFIR